MKNHAPATLARRLPRLCPVALAILSLYGAPAGAAGAGQQAADAVQGGEVVVVTGQRASLRKAIAADPELAQAWRALAKALERDGDQAALETLKSEYVQRFRQPLP
jgi:hypothetical protein